MLDCIPALISGVQNEELVKVPELDEVKRFMTGDSACGPDGFSSVVYQQCWDIIGKDVARLVKAFFRGFTLPRFIAHTKFVLIPKKNNVKHMGDLRPISLSNFINKIFSRLLLERMSNIIPLMISLN